jgi:Outer membrane protein beta-barrel domain
VTGRSVAFVVLGCLCALPCLAQDAEMGIAIGYGDYRNGSVLSADGTAEAGFKNRFVVSAVITEDEYDHISGEFRYLYQDGDPFIRSGGTETRLQGQSHAFSYDVLVHFKPLESRIRPYVTAGVGGKLYIVRGPPNPDQPLSDIATLTTKNDLTLLVVGGAGVKMRLQRHTTVRVDFLDYITPFPKTQIQPVPLATPRGIFHQFTPIVGISYVF